DGIRDYKVTGVQTCALPISLSVVKGVRLQAIFHMAGFVGQGAPVFEIREAGGNATDLLISNNHLGRALAECLGDHDIVLMRGHRSEERRVGKGCRSWWGVGP